MGMGEEKGGTSEEGKGRNKEFAEDFEDDGFEEWKKGILQKAVDAGFKKYEKYI